jgi:hypothetical protein
MKKLNQEKLRKTFEENIESLSKEISKYEGKDNLILEEEKYLSYMEGMRKALEIVNKHLEDYKID